MPVNQMLGFIFGNLLYKCSNYKTYYGTMSNTQELPPSLNTSRTCNSKHYELSSLRLHVLFRGHNQGRTLSLVAIKELLLG